MEGKINKDGCLEFRDEQVEKFKLYPCVNDGEFCGVHCPAFPDSPEPDEDGQYILPVCEGDLVFDKFTDERIAE